MIKIKKSILLTLVIVLLANKSASAESVQSLLNSSLKIDYFDVGMTKSTASKKADLLVADIASFEELLDVIRLSSHRKILLLCSKPNTVNSLGCDTSSLSQLRDTLAFNKEGISYVLGQVYTAEVLILDKSYIVDMASREDSVELINDFTYAQVAYFPSDYAMRVRSKNSEEYKPDVSILLVLAIFGVLALILYRFLFAAKVYPVSIEVVSRTFSKYTLLKTQILFVLNSLFLAVSLSAVSYRDVLNFDAYYIFLYLTDSSYLLNLRDFITTGQPVRVVMVASLVLETFLALWLGYKLTVVSKRIPPKPKKKHLTALVVMIAILLPWGGPFSYSVLLTITLLLLYLANALRTHGLVLTLRQRLDLCLTIILCFLASFILEYFITSRTINHFSRRSVTSEKVVALPAVVTKDYIFTSKYRVDASTEFVAVNNSVIYHKGFKKVINKPLMQGTSLVSDAIIFISDPYLYLKYIAAEKNIDPVFISDTPTDIFAIRGASGSPAFAQVEYTCPTHQTKESNIKVKSLQDDKLRVSLLFKTPACTQAGMYRARLPLLQKLSSEHIYELDSRDVWQRVSILSFDESEYTLIHFNDPAINPIIRAGMPSGDTLVSYALGTTRQATYDSSNGVIDLNHVIMNVAENLLYDTKLVLYGSNRRSKLYRVY